MKCRIWSTSGNFSNRVDVEGKILLRTVQDGNSGLKIAALNGVEQFFQNEAARFRHFNNHEVHMGVELAVSPADFISLPETETKCAHGGVPGGQPCLLGILQRLRYLRTEFVMPLQASISPVQPLFPIEP